MTDARRRVAPRIALAVGFAIAICAGTLAAGQLEGRWGGPHVSLDARGAEVTFQFDCAHGRVDRAIELDKEGRFDMAGTYTAEHPGPEREGESDESRAVRYVGRVTGRSMTLEIVVEGGERLGSFLLQRGQTGAVRKCS